MFVDQGQGPDPGRDEGKQSKDPGRESEDCVRRRHRHGCWGTWGEPSLLQVAKSGLWCNSTMMAYTAVSASGNFAGGGDLYLWGGGGSEKRFSRKKNWVGVCPPHQNRGLSLSFFGWDANPVLMRTGHEGRATSCAACMDGQTLVTGGMEGIVKVLQQTDSLRCTFRW